MNQLCFKCSGELKEVTADDVKGIKFWSCQQCPCTYSENPEGRLFDRWLMPMTLPLYSVISEKEPLSCVERVANEMASKQKRFIDALIEHISQELQHPKQKITDIHDFEYPDEAKLREFLKLVKLGVERRVSESV